MFFSAHAGVSTALCFTACGLLLVGKPAIPLLQLFYQHKVAGVDDAFLIQDVHIVTADIVQEAQIRPYGSHLYDMVSLPPAAGETDVHIARQHISGHVQQPDCPR